MVFHSIYFLLLLFVRKIAAYVGSFGAGVHGLLFAEYDLPNGADQEHCFSGIRRVYQQFVHQSVYGLSDQQYQDLLEQQRRANHKTIEQRLDDEERKRLR